MMSAVLMPYGYIVVSLNLLLLDRRQKWHRACYCRIFCFTDVIFFLYTKPR